MLQALLNEKMKQNGILMDLVSLSPGILALEIKN